MTLEARGLFLRFGDVRALDGIDLTVADSETVAIMGPSGSGKTTLLRVIAGLEPPDEGSIMWNRRSLDAVPPHRRDFGLMFQDYALFPHRTVAGNIAFGLRMQGASREKAAGRVVEVLDLVGLAGMGSRPVGTLSGGEQQRVALARTLAPSPRLILLDEPIGSLDRVLRDRLLEEMRSIFEQLAIGVVYVTHDREEAFAVADRVAIIESGRIVRTGLPKEVWTDPRSEFVARLLGLVNVFPATASEAGIDVGWIAWKADVTDPGTVTGVVIPPESILLRAGGAAWGRVTDSRFVGANSRVSVAVDGGPTVVASTPQPHEIGEEVAIVVAEERVGYLRE